MVIRVRGMVEAATKIKDKKNKLEIYSLAGAASCSSLASEGLSAEVKNMSYISYCSARIYANLSPAYPKSIMSSYREVAA